MTRIELNQEPVVQIRGVCPRDMGRKIQYPIAFSREDIIQAATPSSELNQTVNKLTDLYGFLVGEVESGIVGEIINQNPLVRRFLNKRDALNILPHSDMDNFMLFTGEDGRSQQTAIYPRYEGVVSFFQATRELAPDVFDLYLEDYQRVMGFINRGFLYRFHTDYPPGWVHSTYMSPIKRDPVAHNILRINDYMSRAPREGGIGDAIAFKINQRSHQILVDQQAQYTHAWKPRSLLFISRRVFHQRLCDTVEDVSSRESKLYSARGLYTYPESTI